MAPISDIQFRQWLIAATVSLLLVLPVFFASANLEFASGSENLVVATAMESHRTGEWVLPTLNELPRVKKPPLPMWWTAAFIPTSVIDAGDFQTLHRWVRLSVVPLTWLTLMSVFVIARRLGLSMNSALVAMAACATSLMFARFARSATTDVHLMAWVALANAAWLTALVRKSVTSAVFCGVMLGLAFMSKGPVALAQCGLPMLVMWAWLRMPLGSAAQWISGMIAFSLVAFPWYVAVYMSKAGVAGTWLVELHRSGATAFKADSPFTYVTMLALVFPWSVFFIVGLIDGAQRTWKRVAWDMPAIAFVLLALPVLVMSFFPDRKDRYLLPMIVPASLLVAHGFGMVSRKVGRFNATDKWVLALHWVLLSAGPVVVGWMYWQQNRVGLAATIVLGLLTAVAVGVWLSRRNIANVVVVTALVATAVNVLTLLSYSTTREGRSELRPLAREILSQVADPEVIHVNPEGLFLGPNDLAIYLNRTVTLRTRVEDVPAQGPRQQVLVMMQPRKVIEPLSIEGWHTIAGATRDSDIYWAFVRQIGR